MGKKKKERKKSETKFKSLSNTTPIGGGAWVARDTAEFRTLNKLTLNDPNKCGHSHHERFFRKYSKDDISRFLQDPCKSENEKGLRRAVVYMYTASSHFRRIIQYFAGLTDFAYTISLTGVDTAQQNIKTVRKQYLRVCRMLENMDIPNQGRKIVTVSLREDTCFVTMWITNDNVTMQILPWEYCKIASIEGNVPNVSFDFSYFEAHEDELAYYPAEFGMKYALYRENRLRRRWQELDAPNSFAVKCNSDMPEYSVPPFAGVLRELYDLEDYKTLKRTKAEIENYALLVMRLGGNEKDGWDMETEKAQEIWSNLSHVVPDEIGTVLSPMAIEKISFEKSNTGDTDTITEAENHLFSEAGVSTLLFNNEKASSNALLLSIKADQAITYGIVKGLEAALNRFIQAQSFGKNFKMTFLNSSAYNAKELQDGYLKACQYGLPFISHYAAAAGMTQSDVDGMNFLEQDVLKLNDKFQPLQSSSTLSADESERGRPEADMSELSDSGERSQERDDED